MQKDVSISKSGGTGLPSLVRMLEFAGAISLVLYGAGFLVVAFHYGRFGATTLEIFSAQYLAAGCVFAASAAIYFLTIGHAIVQFSAVDEYPASSFRKQNLFWRIVGITFAILELTFSHAFAVTLTVALFFESNLQIIQMAGLLGFFFLVSRVTIWRQEVSWDLLRFAAVFQLGIYSLGCFMAYRLWGDIGIAKLAVTYGALAFGIFGLLHFLIGVSPSWKTGFWVLLALAASASIFGALIFSSVRHNLGGGQPLSVRLILSPNVSVALRSSLHEENGISKAVDLIGESSTYYFFLICEEGKKCNRATTIRKELVEALMPP